MNHHLDKHKNVLVIALVISVAAQINIDAPKASTRIRVSSHRCNRSQSLFISLLFR